MKYYSYKQMRCMLMRRFKDAGFGIAAEKFSFQVTVHVRTGVYNFDSVDEAFAMVQRLIKEGRSYTVELKLVNDIELFNQLIFSYE